MSCHVQGTNDDPFEAYFEKQEKLQLYVIGIPNNEKEISVTLRNWIDLKYFLTNSDKFKIKRVVYGSSPNFIRIEIVIFDDDFMLGLSTNVDEIKTQNNYVHKLLGDDLIIDNQTKLLSHYFNSLNLSFDGKREIIKNIAVVGPNPNSGEFEYQLLFK